MVTFIVGVQERGKWAFLAPLAVSAWIMLGATTVVVPLFVFFFEALFSERCELSSPEKTALHGLDRLVQPQPSRLIYFRGFA